MLPSLQAREGLQRIHEQMYASGNMEKRGAGRFIANLENAASRVDGRRAVYRPKNLKDLARLMGSTSTNLKMDIVLEE